MRFWTGGLLLTTAFAQQQATITTTSQEVLLDLVVRDRNGHLVKDLKPNEITVTEDGVAQVLRSMKLRTGAEISSIGPNPTDKIAELTKNPAVNPLRDVRTVTFAFDPMAGSATRDRRHPESASGASASILARRVAGQLLQAATGANFYWGVLLTTGRGVRVLQGYTTDKEKLDRAVAKATLAPGTVYAESGGGGGDSGAPAAQPAEGTAGAAMATVTRNMTEFNQDADFALHGDSAFRSIRNIIRELQRLPGRKTLIYFTNGLVIPPEWRTEFVTLIADANRANVTVYCIDSTLSSTGYGSGSGSDMLSAAAAASASGVVGNGPTTRGQILAADHAESAIMLNPHLALLSLAEDTGGFVVGTAFNLDKMVNRLSEEINTYYELTYSPVIEKYDGHFRKIEVHVARRNVKVQSRSGYFALPYVAGQTLSGFEIPLLNALNATKVPKAVPFHAAVKSFGAATEVIVQVPLDTVTMVKDEAAKTFQCNLALLVLFKDAQGNIVRKLSEDVPVSNTLLNLDSIRSGAFIYTHHLELPPARYTFEVAVMDRSPESLPTGVKKQSVVVPQPADLALSSLSLIRKLAPPMPIIMDEENPFEFDNGRITPELKDTVKGGKGASIPIYLVAYGAHPEEAKLTIEFQQDGKVVARTEPPLPRPDPRGRIQVVANLPIDSIKPGQYEIYARVVQAGKSVQDRMLLNVEE